MILKNHFNNFFRKTLESLNEILIPFFVKNKMFNFLVILFFFNIFKIKRILPKSKTKYKAVVLQNWVEMKIYIRVRKSLIKKYFITHVQEDFSKLYLKR